MNVANERGGHWWILEYLIRTRIMIGIGGYKSAPERMLNVGHSRAAIGQSERRDHSRALATYRVAHHLSEKFAIGGLKKTPFLKRLH